MSTPTSGAVRTCETCKGSIATDAAFCPYCRHRQRKLPRSGPPMESWDTFRVLMYLLAPLGLALMIAAIPTCEQEYKEQKQAGWTSIETPGGDSRS